MRDRKKIRQRKQAQAGQTASAVDPGAMPDDGHEAILSWCDREYDEVPGIAQAALGFLIGSGFVVARRLNGKRVTPFRSES